ncbi:hypothetical protein ACFODZ_10425 [Marinicella sediminis]|uniref:Uncharacterized protein n=1 Tax=Marinicella sediminis TaxID=1792834 RepID=A0ABV7JGY0_9GAMM
MYHSNGQKNKPRILPREDKQHERVGGDFYCIDPPIQGVCQLLVIVYTAGIIKFGVRNEKICVVDVEFSGLCPELVIGE